jgi:hypothetical protein
MNIEKAIELLEQDYGDPGSVNYTDLMEAQALGIQALKRLRHDRQVVQPEHVLLLPGEVPK